ncbi:MAG: AAA family ATPase, partial [Actinomycetota bacterium]|nr:AAA family ATPase [Actinomycetota bacterium]
MQQDHPDGRPAEGRDRDDADVTAQIRMLEDEVTVLRRRVTESPRHVRLLEERLAEASASVAQLTERNSKLVETLRDARSQLLALREEVDRLAQPPSGYGIFVTGHDDGTVDVFTSGRRMRVAVSPAVEVADLRRGQSVRLNEALTVVQATSFEATGEVCALREILAGGERALVVGHADEERVVWLADPLTPGSLDIEAVTLKPGDSLLVDTKAGYAYERVPKAEVEDLLLEEVPDVGYADIGGLGSQIEQIRDAVELPFLHAELFRTYELRPPKGVLLYGPPGCGKTLIAKAVANSLAKKVAQARGDDGDDSDHAKSYFLNIKGPELLNKFVGETERHIRLIFQRAREKAS